MRWPWERKMQRFTIVMTLTLVVCSYADGSYTSIYWTDWQGDNNVHRSNLDGSNAQVVITSTFSNPYGIAFDMSAGIMYIADYGGSDGVGSTPSISRANIDGSGIQQVHTGGRPTDVAVDNINHKVYWTDEGLNNVWRANLDGSNPEILISGYFNMLYGITLDLLHGKMYLAEIGVDGGLGSIACANLDGSAIQRIVVGGKPTDIALDSHHGKLYWTSWAGNNVMRSNLDGSGAEALVWECFSNPYGIALDVENNKMYVADIGGYGSGSTPSVSRFNLDGTGLEFLQMGGRPTDIALIPEPCSTLLFILGSMIIMVRR